MELIQSTFQASFNARIERLAEQETNELRTIFRYFDTDGDGAVAADQILRIFGLLGLDINPAYVRDLEEVYLAEFLKIVDSNIPAPASEPGATVPPSGGGSVVMVPPLATSSSAASISGGAPAQMADSTTGDTAATSLPVLDEATLQEQRNAQLWEDEWRSMDSYRRGYLTHGDLQSFLKSCFSPFPLRDLDRFLELYSDPELPEDSMTLTKAAFLKFRREYTALAAAPSEAGPLSDEEGEEEEDVVDMDAQQAQENDANGQADADQSLQNHADQLAKKRRASQAAGISVIHSDGDAEGIVIDPGVMVDELFVEEDDEDEYDDEGSDVDVDGDEGYDSHEDDE